MLTVLLATRNRSQVLREVLETYTRLQAPPDGWKLVVVDNRSTDQTAHVVASFADRLPVQYLFEGKLGKNFALNTGLALAEGDLTVFTDDDVFPRADWLVQFRQTADAQPAYSMFGGAVLPRWDAPPPRWIQWVETAPVYSLTDPTLKEGPIEPHHIFGPSMAIRNRALKAGTHFDPSIGPRGSSYPMGSETELVLRLGREGHRAWYVPAAAVEHLIRKEQLNKQWVLERAIRFGRGQYRLYRADELGTRNIWMGTPLYLLRKMLREAAIMAMAGACLRRKAWFHSRWRFNYLRGMASEARILVRERLATAESAFALTRLKQGLRRH